MDRKSACFLTAAQLTAAVAANFPDTFNADPEIKDGPLRGLNLTVWELFRIFYSACAGAMDDETSWKSPISGAASKPGDTASAGNLASLVTALTPIAGTLSPAIQAILMAAGAAIPAANVPGISVAPKS